MIVSLHHVGNIGHIHEFKKVTTDRWDVALREELKEVGLAQVKISNKGSFMVSNCDKSFKVSF